MICWTMSNNIPQFGYSKEGPCTPLKLDGEQVLMASPADVRPSLSSGGSDRANDTVLHFKTDAPLCSDSSDEGHRASMRTANVSNNEDSNGNASRLRKTSARAHAPDTEEVQAGSCNDLDEYVLSLMYTLVFFMRKLSRRVLSALAA